MKSSFLKKRKKLPGDMALQITSMADIFMILLVFLLKNYAVSMTNIAPTAHLTLPDVTNSKGSVKETLKVEIASDIILIDALPVVKLKNFEFEPAEAAENGSSPTVSKTLGQQRQLKPEANMDSSLVVMADKSTPYSTLKRVIASAAGAGFVDLQLIVVDNE